MSISRDNYKKIAKFLVTSTEDVIVNIQDEHGNTPLHLACYNDNNTKIESCWTINKQGICIIKKDALKEWNNRLNILSDTINKWITTTSSKTIEVIHLFYDKTK